MTDIHIKQFEMSELDALLSFLHAAYPGEPLKSDPKVWKWHFLENPNVDPSSVPIWIAKDGDKIVGQVAGIPVGVNIGTSQRRAIWLVDFFVLPEYRLGGLGISLFQAPDGDTTVLLSLGYNDNSAAVMRLLRWQPLGRIHRHHILLYPGHAADKLRPGTARSLLNLLYAPYRALLRRRRSAGTLRPVTSFDDAFDELWEDASTQWPCAVVRNARWLDWQFKCQPGKKYDVLGYYDAGRLLGYIVLFFRKGTSNQAPPKASISDLCYGTTRSEEVIDDLLRGALQLALERRAGSLVADVLDERVDASLRRLRFRRIKDSPRFAIKCTDRELASERRDWFLTRSDSDLSIFEEPNL